MSTCTGFSPPSRHNIKVDRCPLTLNYLIAILRNPLVVIFFSTITAGDSLSLKLVDKLLHIVFQNLYKSDAD